MVFPGQVALITGGCRGIGKAMGSALLNLGARVSLLDIQDAEGKELQRDLADKYGKDNCIYVPCDVTESGQLEAAFKETKKAFGNINIVCNNAGIAEIPDWEKMIEINFKAVIRGTKLGIEYMSSANSGSGGVIINVASLAGIAPLKITPIYTATKMGVVGFTRCLEDLAITDNIRVTALCPAFVKTPLLENSILQVPEMEAVVKSEVEKLGLKFELMSPEYIAEAAIKLIQDKNNAGKALSVTVESGLQYIDFQKITK